ncbi:MAG: hypothetical protein WCG78_05905 [Candidatus Omnitrophota bacterium]
MNTDSAIFERLFGIKSSQVKKRCVLLPIATKEMITAFGVGDMKRGKIYAAGESGAITIIRTGMGPAFVGDAVLYLKESPCEEVVLFGSCGAVSAKNGLDIGSLASPAKCYALDSFHATLSICGGGSRTAPADTNICYPDKEESVALLKEGVSEEVCSVTCATVGSLKLEEEMGEWFAARQIDVVDMECAAFFTAAHHTGLKAAALLYVSDILHKKPYYMPSNSADQKKRARAIARAADLLHSILS